jgi:hypothetical protein
MNTHHLDFFEQSSEISSIFDIGKNSFAFVGHSEVEQMRHCGRYTASRRVATGKSLGGEYERSGGSRAMAEERE